MMSHVWLGRLLLMQIMLSINYPFMISLNKCTESFNVFSPKICVQKETKDVNVKVFKTITNENEAKAMNEHIPCHCKWKFSSVTCNSNQK